MNAVNSRKNNIDVLAEDKVPVCDFHRKQLE